MVLCQRTGDSNLQPWSELLPHVQDYRGVLFTSDAGLVLDFCGEAGAELEGGAFECLKA